MEESRCGLVSGFLWYLLGEPEKNNGYLNKDHEFHAEI